MRNSAADAWAEAAATAADIAAKLTVGDVLSYDSAERQGEQVWSELRQVLRPMTLVDEGDGYEVRGPEGETLADLVDEAGKYLDSDTFDPKVADIARQLVYAWQYDGIRGDLPQRWIAATR